MLEYAIQWGKWDVTAPNTWAVCAVAAAVMRALYTAAMVVPRNHTDSALTSETVA